MRRLFLVTQLLMLTGALVGPARPARAVDYRAEMIQFVETIAAHARAVQPDFGVFPQNAAALGADSNYVATVTGIGQEDMHYGYDKAGRATDAAVTAALATNLVVFRDAGRIVLTVDYPFPNKHKPQFKRKTLTAVQTCYADSLTNGFIPYCTVLELDALVVNPGFEPQPNLPAITNWSQVREFTYQLQPSKKQSRAQFLTALGQSRFDLIVMDYSFDGSAEGEFTPEEITALKTQLGGKVLAYLSIGEAEDYRWYWQADWKKNPPAWLDRENPNWKGNYEVRYWQPEWQAIILQYLDKIIAAGYDGVYLDLVDNYEYYESQP